MNEISQRTITISRPPPNGLGDATDLEYDWIELYLTPLGNPVVVVPPEISALIPNTIASGSGNFTLTINGSSFQSGSLIDFGGVQIAETSTSPTQVQCLVQAIRITTPGTVEVFVLNPDGGYSNMLPFTIT